MPELNDTIPVNQEATVIGAPSKSKRHLLLITLLILITFLLSLVLGIKLGQNKSFSVPLLGMKQAPPVQTVWTNQSATIRGEILKLEGNLLTVKNNYGISGKVILFRGVNIFKDNYSSPSTKIDQIELNKEALLVLKNINGYYQVTSILYAPETNYLPKKASSSADLKN